LWPTETWLLFYAYKRSAGLGVSRVYLGYYRFVHIRLLWLCVRCETLQMSRPLHHPDEECGCLYQGHEHEFCSGSRKWEV
jgi:hypothetical protein